MDEKYIQWAEVDEQGRLVLPPEVVAQFGLRPGTRARIETDAQQLRLHRPTDHLAKVYIEPTNRCNLDCRTCMRNTWDDPLGRMSGVTFDRIIAGLEALSTRPRVMFGGIGEPLSHPRILEMVARVKKLGGEVELITNGTMLSEARSRALIAAGLDTLWVSLDGATPESYEDVRLGAELPQVLDNLRALRSKRSYSYHPKPTLGIAFVAMKRNIADLPRLITLGRSVGATRFSVSNVLPYSDEMVPETLYDRSLHDAAYLASDYVPQVSLPKMDLNELTQEAFLGTLRSGCAVTFAGNRLSGANDVCNFIESGSISIGWDGAVAPCLPLLHNHIAYLHKKPRRLSRHVIGNINARDLFDLWNDPEYRRYRERVQGFGFPPCTFCGGCEMVEENGEDCLGNTFPACGGCLWSQGVIHCP